ncbi:hypothetical protein KIPB_006815 [Kipferlia bialata]|uniref:C2H2-type domain-containing protein n=1 Tax=Kipferlia bialata TaxID=797122 RepID=A0A9K3GJE1_9EUKA|nr:hypothetical protein KIPB_006815 [Kipferlia bialata]|eukprot:g6815.t1
MDQTRRVHLRQTTDPLPSGKSSSGSAAVPAVPISSRPSRSSAPCTTDTGDGCGHPESHGEGGGTGRATLPDTHVCVDATCGVLCKSQEALIEHYKIRHDNCPYRCLVPLPELGFRCHSVFKSKRRLQKHHKRHHPSHTLDTGVQHQWMSRGSRPDAVPHQPPILTTTETASCPYCELVQSVPNVNRHINLEHLGIRYKCALCDSFFETKQDASLHMKEAHPDTNYQSITTGVLKLSGEGRAFSQCTEAANMLQ